MLESRLMAIRRWQRGWSRSRLRFSSKTMLLAISAIGVALGLWRWSTQEQRIIAALEDAGGHVRTYSPVPYRVPLLGGRVLQQARSVKIPDSADVDLRCLEWLSHLEAIRVEGPQFTDASMRHLRNLSELSLLQLPGARITDFGLGYVQGLTGLRFLDLSSTEVTTSGLRHLRGLQRLEMLNLAGTEVDDGAIEHLKKLPALRVLFIADTELAEHQNRDRLRRALPDVVLDVDVRIEELLGLAFEYSERGDDRRAIAFMDELVSLASQDHVVYYNRGTLHLRQDGMDQAIADLSRAIELAPNFSAAYLNRGRAFAGLNRWEEALADFDKVLELDPTDLNGLHNRGDFYRQMEEFAPALVDFDTAIRVDSAQMAGWFNRGLTHYERGDLRSAVADYSEAIRRAPKGKVLSTIYERRAIALHKMGDSTRASADFATALKIDPGLISAYRHRAAVHQVLGQQDKPDNGFAKAEELDWSGRRLGESRLKGSIKRLNLAAEYAADLERLGRGN